MKFKIIDLFAGPGGLGEGFASLNRGNSFEIVVSAEMESSAHKTLTLRSFFRHIRGNLPALKAYYKYCNIGDDKNPSEVFGKDFPVEWAAATSEARQLKLGEPEDNLTLDKILTNAELVGKETIVIGGPPCQAYSLVGRARNQGIAGYAPENDPRHFLYKEYLRILAKVKPAVFVMENVKGILSSKVQGRRVFHDILKDLTNPSGALGKHDNNQYTIYSLVTPTKFRSEDDPVDINLNDFVIKAEKFGIPQARHRVILLGVRNDIGYKGGLLLTPSAGVSVKDAIGDFEPLRSKLSREDSAVEWNAAITQLGNALAADAEKQELPALAKQLAAVAKSVKSNLETGALRYPRSSYGGNDSVYSRWVNDPKVLVWLNHETRSHMTSDLGRYLYAAVFTAKEGRSPKGHKEFALEGLAPKHANWETGKFSDRFRVQRYSAPSTTITSHISKDGHYFIHPDPLQCRSLTVREAARLQTFPDNYFFQGNRTQQFHQVGNAVPSLLANQIAAICYVIISKTPQN